ncbi:hypothetical protein L2K70_00265 [Nocardioides KLBMP 9356]|uniref:Secreted protein n=1 Tax=Nocardioides potassii TaxID=2911371 RepID=A0ABS9H6U2_9ACTN|nr:hypothetical protein [Nocardioides potassii]MCF6376033.1 hypothetical protein [Nocardioides potassii]
MHGRTTTTLALLVVLTGCTGTDAPTDDPATPEPSSAPAGGTLDDPATVEPREALLDWNATGYGAASRAVIGERWTGIVPDDQSAACVSDRTATGGEDEVEECIEVTAGAGRTISELLMSEDWAVVVTQDTAETAPSKVVAIDLATGEEHDVVSPVAASGGSWALTGGDLYYPTYGDGGAYCLATSALADSNGEDGWCAPLRTGFSNLTASEHGVGMMTFDDGRPACRTLNILEAGVPRPIDGPTECTGWDVAATADGVVWSEVPRPRRQEEAVFRASAGGEYFDLGPGTTGTALPCGDSVFFVRDPQGPDEPARLMRWTPDHTLEVAYESRSVGNAFLGEPACGGGVLTLSSYGEEGDEMVWATVT